MGKRADTIRKQTEQHGRIHEEATVALLDADPQVAVAAHGARAAQRGAIAILLHRRAGGVTAVAADAVLSAILELVRTGSV